MMPRLRLIDKCTLKVAGIIIFSLLILALAIPATTLADSHCEQPKKQDKKETKEAGEKTDKTENDRSDEQRFPVSKFILEYDSEHDSQIPLKSLEGRKLRLGKADNGLTAPTKKEEVFTWILGNPPEGDKFFYADGLRAVCNQLVNILREEGYLGVYVTVSRDDINPNTATDKRELDKTLHLTVHTTQVEKVRTLASGDRIPEDKRINNPAHAPIRSHSPIAGGEVLKSNVLNNYIFRLNRHPGRNVDMAVSAGDEPGEAVLDYMVTENKPWTAYFQLNNTGTESTDKWRERFGFTHRQVTGRDDILRLDYVTTKFDEVNALVGSYEMPVKWLYSDLRIYGSWNEYTASEVGRAEDAFEGEGWHTGAELTYNIFQDGPLFIDLLGGARYKHTSVTNNLFGVEGKTDFLLPYLGIELERQTRLARTGASLDVEYNMANWADTEADELPPLGRLDVDKYWTAAHWNAYQSFFLEPLIFGKDFKDAETPESSTLAHEMFFEIKGQYSFGDRLVPQQQMTVGGMHTVRGYPDSAVAGDDVYIARGEYRFHLPRFFKPVSKPPQIPLLGRPFRVAPQHTFGYPDWDLQLKAFVDWGRVENSDQLNYENDETLLGAGLGIDLQILSNLNASLEWGRALKDLDSQGIDKGNDEIHFSLTLMY